MKRFALLIVLVSLVFVSLAFAQAPPAPQSQSKEVALTEAQSAQLELAFRRQADIRQRIDILTLQLQELQRQTPEVDKALRETFAALCQDTGLDATASTATSDFKKLVGKLAAAKPTGDK